MHPCHLMPVGGRAVGKTPHLGLRGANIPIEDSDGQAGRSRLSEYAFEVCAMNPRVLVETATVEIARRARTRRRRPFRSDDPRGAPDAGPALIDSADDVARRGENF